MRSTSPCTRASVRARTKAATTSAICIHSDILADVQHRPAEPVLLQGRHGFAGDAAASPTIEAVSRTRLPRPGCRRREQPRADAVQVRHEAVDHDRHGDRGEHERAQDGRETASQSPSTRLRAVSVGKTQSQIMRASWCLLGGGMRLAVSGCRRRCGGGGFQHGVLSVRHGSVLISSGRPANRGPDVLFDQVGVDRDRGGGPFAGGGDHLGTRVDDVAGHPDAGNAREPAAPVIAQPSSSRSQPRPDEQVVVRDESRRDEERVAREPPDRR